MRFPPSVCWTRDERASMRRCIFVSVSVETPVKRLSSQKLSAGAPLLGTADAWETRGEKPQLRKQQRANHAHRMHSELSGRNNSDLLLREGSLERRVRTDGLAALVRGGLFANDRSGGPDTGSRWPLSTLTFRENSFLREWCAFRHTVISTNPYRSIRHPLSASALLFFLGTSHQPGEAAGAYPARGTRVA